MASSPTRDNSMYEKLDADYIKAVKKERRQKNFDLSNYLPNSLRKDQSPNQSQLTLNANDSVISDNSRPYKKVAMSAHKGHTSSINRLASLADLDT